MTSKKIKHGRGINKRSNFRGDYSIISPGSILITYREADQNLLEKFEAEGLFSRFK